MTERLALLSAILANPEDDLPRLVFADWLDEHGTTDADAARSEFIRLGCQSKAKSRITPAETRWLDANWQRLLVNTLAARPMGAKRPRVERDGRHLRMRFRWSEGSRVRAAEMTFEFVRGFVRRVEYLQGHAYQRFWRATTTDEPLAYHRPELPPDLVHGSDRPWTECRLLPTTWGNDVYEQTEEYDAFHTGGTTRFTLYWMVKREVTTLHPLAAADEPLIDLPQHRLRAAVATAMTSLAREFVGLTKPTPGG